MIHARNLRCEFLHNPLGIDTAHPRLSWELESDGRGERQTAYRILVAASPESLQADRGGLWDTGRVASDQSSMIPYRGVRLESHARCCWKVMVWDQDEAPGPWSAVAEWSMGILEASGWVARWVGYDAPRLEMENFPRAPAQWIWAPGEKFASLCALATTVEINPSKRIEGVELAVAARRTFRLFINGRQAAVSAEGAEAWKHPQIVREASLFRAGANTLYAEATSEEGATPGFILWLVIRYDDGTEISTGTSSVWRAAEHAMPSWKSDGPSDEDGLGAHAFGFFGIAPWRLLDESTLRLPPARYLKGTFLAPKPLKRALLYGSAFGIADFYVNGTCVSDDRFTPGWTDYSRRLYYRAYEVTHLLARGPNTLGAILADGWFSGYIGWGALRDHYGSRPRLLAQLHMEFDDGTTEEFGTGESWLASTGAVREADLLMGERFDGREFHQEFFLSETAPGARVDLGAELRPVLEAHPGPPVRSFAELAPVSIAEPKPGVWVFDLGRNFAGVVRLRVREERGREITLRYAERLSADGMVYTENLRGARVRDSYICGGTGMEVWEPRFTFHGFQYVEVTGLSQRPEPGTVTGVAFSSDTPVAGEFECSSTMLNQLASNIYWTQRANFIEIPTDCPQRDERLGWTGDAQVYARSACLNVDAQAFFRKWLTDLADAQRADGQFPMVAPLKAAEADGGPAWADAGVICPWTVYEIYGDRSILSTAYESMKRFVEFCTQRSPGLLPPEQFHCFGDWLNIQADTPKEVIATAYFARSSRLLARASEVLGRTHDAERYERLAEDVAAAFRRAYVRRDGTLLGETQTAYALALSFGLLEAEQVPLAAQHLVRDIQQRGWRLSTGFVGTRELMNALSMIGRQDVGYRLLLCEEFPSWGFTIGHGATSIWERWDGWTPERGFQDPLMNSFAHYAFGAVYEWIVATIGGITSKEPGFGRMRIAPVLDPHLEWARLVYRSVRGPVVSAWKRSGGRLRLSVDIPANTSCTVVLPMVPGTVSESGALLDEARGISMGGDEGPGVTLVVGSGHYEFDGEELGPLPNP